VLLPNLPGDWNGVPVRDRLAAALGRPVAMVNDARAFSLAEALLGAARGLGTVVCLVLGTGVGGGIVVDGRLLRGTGGAGEIGHQTVLLGGPRCGCGNSGCAEALTRADVLARRGGRATAEDVYRAARAGDATARAAVEHVVRWLGVALANAYVLLAPDAFVVGGGIAAAGDLLLGPLEAAVRRHVFLVPPERIRVLPAALGPYAGAIGAALVGREADGDTLKTASIA
jgi:glucokinase